MEVEKKQAAILDFFRNSLLVGNLRENRSTEPKVVLSIGEQRGEQRDEQKTLEVVNLYLMNNPIEVIAKATELSIEKVNEIISRIKKH